MQSRAKIFVAVVLFAGLLAVAAGCNGDEAGDQATEIPDTTPDAAVTPTSVPGTAGPTLTPAPDIMQQDLSLQPGLAEFLASAGDVYVRVVKPTDLTKDGVRDALAIVASTGEGGDIAAFVYGYSSGGLQELLRVVPESGTLTVDTFRGNLVVAEPVYQPGDPLCCPSEMRTRVYEWDGSKFAVADEEIRPGR